MNFCKNNELLIIYLAAVTGRRKVISQQHKALSVACKLGTAVADLQLSTEKLFVYSWVDNCSLVKTVKCCFFSSFSVDASFQNLLFHSYLFRICEMRFGSFVLTSKLLEHSWFCQKQFHQKKS